MAATEKDRLDVVAARLALNYARKFVDDAQVSMACIPVDLLKELLRWVVIPVDRKSYAAAPESEHDAANALVNMALRLAANNRTSLDFAALSKATTYFYQLQTDEVLALIDVVRADERNRIAAVNEGGK